MVKQKIEGMGWNYKIDPQPFHDNMDNIRLFADEHFHQEYMGFELSLMLAFFHYSIEDINYFQKEMGYFPYDGCSDLCKNFVDDFYYGKRNECLAKKCLGFLVEKGYLKKINQTFNVVNNPYSKIVNRTNNLNTLLP